MKLQKKLLACLSMLTLSSQLVGCSNSISAVPTTSDALKVLCSSYPVYEWASAIVGDTPDVEVMLLMNNGVDPHNYQATADDIIKIQTSDMLIYIGGETEGWISDALANAPDVEVVNLMEHLDSFLLETSDPCCEEDHVHDEDCDHSHDEHEHDDCCEEDHVHTEDYDHSHDEHEHDDCCEEEHVHTEDCDHSHDEHEHDDCCEEEHIHTEDCDHDHSEEVHVHGEDCDHGHDHYYDEHIWLSVKLAIESCDIITDAISDLDPDSAKQYAINSASYVFDLEELDDKFQAVVDKYDNNMLIFGDRFPFRYLTNDYGINYCAAFASCTTDTEASFETIIGLAESLNNTSANAVNYITLEDVAKTVVQSSNDTSTPLIQWNSIENIDFLDPDISYIFFMEQNLQALEEALK
ncbi:MAG: hypothetical protein ATN35_00920 [Epulopiscium sp. Nele67-Bin004]|nr:MAG: hypothetical protein ATN35_00920 [Epulopiscium sp. Nele67-Bin004]